APDVRKSLSLVEMSARSHGGALAPPRLLLARLGGAIRAIGLADLRHARQRLRDDGRLLLVVLLQRALRRRRALGAADVAHRVAILDQLAQALDHEGPRAHVLRLFLDPEDLLEVRVAIDDVPDDGPLERRELLD